MAAWTGRAGVVLWVAGVLCAAVAGAETVRVDGYTQPFRELEIASEIGGIVQSVAVEEGQRVAAGGLLVELKADVRAAQLATSRAAVAAAEAQVAAADARRASLAQILEGVADLHEKGIESDEEYEKARLDCELAGLAAEQARAQLQVSRLRAAQDQVLLDQTRITAPIDGHVVRVLRREGESVAALGPVVTLVVLDPLRVIAQLPVRTAGGIRPGARGTLALETMPQQPLECTVDVVDPLAGEGSGLYVVQLRLPNPGGRIMAGLNGKVALELSDTTHNADTR